MNGFNAKQYISVKDDESIKCINPENREGPTSLTIRGDLTPEEKKEFEKIIKAMVTRRGLNTKFGDVLITALGQEG